MVSFFEIIYMNKDSFALVICDIYPSTSGQAVVSRQVFNILENYYRIMHVPLSYNSKEVRRTFLFRIFFIFIFIFKLYSFLLKRSDKKIIYFTPSRGKVSIYRDFIILLMLKLFKNNIQNNNIKIFSHLHGSDMKKNYDKFFIKSFFRTTYNELKINIIILDDFHKNFALGKRYRYYSIIPNFIKLSDIKYSKKIIETRSKEFIKFKKKLPSTLNFLHLSGVLKNKGLDFSIRFIEKLNSDLDFINYKTSFHLDIVGWKKSDFILIYPNLKMTIEKMEKNSLIQFHGKITDNSDLNKIYSKTHFNILLSETEGQPLSLIETAGFGGLSIINNVDFISQLLSKIDGIVIERNNLVDGVLKFKKYIYNTNEKYFYHDNCLVRYHKINKYFNKETFKKNILSII